MKHVDKIKTLKLLFSFQSLPTQPRTFFLKKSYYNKRKSAFINIPSKYERLEVKLLKSASQFRTLVKHKDKRANYFSDWAFSWDLANHSDCVYPFTPNRSIKKTSF